MDIRSSDYVRTVTLFNGTTTVLFTSLVIAAGYSKDCSTARRKAVHSQIFYQQRNIHRPAQPMLQNNLNVPLLVQLQILQLLWLKFVIIAIYFLPFLGIWALGGRITSDAYDDFVWQGWSNVASFLRDLLFVMNPVMQPVVSVLLLQLATQNLVHDGNGEVEL